MVKTTKNRVFKEVTMSGDVSTQFQTPREVADYMISLIPQETKTILEPTMGKGNLTDAIARTHPEYSITAPINFFLMPKSKFDCVVMNPPFSEKFVFGLPDGYLEKGMRVGYDILLQCMDMTDNVIALMPWFTITDSDTRLRLFKAYGLKGVTALPRKTFDYSRIQTCVIELQRGFQGEAAFKTFHY